MKRCKIGLLIMAMLMLTPSVAYAGRETVRYEAEQDYPPYKYTQNGYLTGFDIDLTSMIFEQKDYEMEYGTGSWSEVYSGLAAGEIDTGGLMAVTAGRREDILFSDTVLKSYISVYGRNTMDEEVSLRTLSRFRIGVGREQYTELVLRQKAGITEYITYDTVPEALGALERGEIDLLFENQEVVDYLIVEKGLTGTLSRKLERLYPVNIAYGVSRDAAELVPYINERIRHLRSSGVYEELYQRYFFTHSEYYKEMVHSRWATALVLFGVAAVAGIVMLRMYIVRLRRTIYAEQAFFGDVVHHTGLMVWGVDAGGTTVRFNTFAEEVTGLSREETIGRKLEDLQGRNGSLDNLLHLLGEAVKGQLSENVELALYHHGRAVFRYFTLRTTLIQGLDKHAPVVIVLVGMDIDQRKSNELKLQASYEELEATYEELAATEAELNEQLDKLRISDRRFRLASEGSGAYIWELDWETGLYRLSERWYEVMGYTEQEIDALEGGVISLIHPDDRDTAERARRLHLEGYAPVYETEYRMRTKNGSYVWFAVRGKAMQDPERGIHLFLGSLIDISSRKQIEIKLGSSYRELEATYEQLSATQHELVGQYDQLLENQKKMHQLAYFDSLSHLPNRVSLLESMESYFHMPEGRAALFFVDTDNFKYINDTLGHKFGDILIREVSGRLSAAVGEEAMLSRLGGDEFVIFLKDQRDPQRVLALADHILEQFRQPFPIGESSTYVSVSIGISFYPEHGTTTEEMLKNADVAMYRAKEAGKGRYVVYDKHMHKTFNERMNIEKYMRGAIENEEFELYYQPQIVIGTGEISGFEALVRWNSPELGFVTPLAFIKVAEDSRLIVPLGEWVLRKACQFMKQVHDEGASHLNISVNISVIQMLQDDFAERVLDIVEECGLEPRYLELEITESIFMESFEQIVSKLNFLQSRGITFALDDFGTGYSSLSYLQKLPISTLKMDKIFIDSLSEDSYSQSFIETMVVLGHKLGLEVVAEGIERPEQLQFLSQAGCDKAQGYLVSRPVPQAQAELLAASGKRFNF